MSIFFGILFMLGGLALAVLLGIVLYRDPQKKARVGLTNGEGAEAAQG